jgi:hypothetical protein
VLAAMPTGRLWAVILMPTALATVYLLAAAPLVKLYGERRSVLEKRRMLLPRLRAVAEAT